MGLRPATQRRLQHPRLVARENAALPAEPIDAFAALVLVQAGIDPRVYRAKPIQRRLAACLRQLRAPDAASAEQRLQSSPELLPFALDTLLIGVTGFFRDPAVFQHLRAIIVPALLRERAGLNVYAAGVSGGHELYSVAMLLDERGALAGSTLLGVDCRTHAIAQARAGRFDGEELVGLTPEQRQKYFAVAGGVAVARPHLRSRMEWRCRDLFSDASAAIGADLILFRNVAIYLEPPAAAQVYERFAAQLAPGGILVTGKAEHPPRTLPFTKVAPSIFRKT